MLSTIKKLQADILYSGVVYGTSGNNTPDAAAAITVCRKHGIRRIRILDTDELAIQSLKSMGIEATVGVKDEDLPVLASSYEAVKSWFEANLKPYVPFEFVVNYIVVGNQFIPGPNGKYVLPVVKNLQRVLADNKLSQIKVATLVSTAVLRAVFPPSKAAFSAKAEGDLIPLLQHLQATVTHTHRSYWNMFDALVDAFVWAMEKRELIVKMVIGETGWPSTGNGQTTTPELARTYNQNFLRHITAGQSPILIEVCPCYFFADGLICQDFATFSAHKAVYWDNGLGYWNMFDALVDAFVWAMEKRELIVKMVIGETGWPSTGNGQTTTPELARTYNQNFLRHITAGQCTPKRPNTYGEGFVYSMFDENGKLEAGDQGVGIFDANEKPVYHLYFLYPKSASN
ncbi:putative glucan endo-1 [Quercus suber]|uniref:glucan endo-1,3-beta-D-glucosidase n=1 Tax=Quercus suber TaxID=58331 RepID=A0AAW0KW49_QUESU